MPRKESHLWSKCCTNIVKQANGDRAWDCKFCGVRITGTKTRLTAHLGGISKYGTNACAQVPEDIKKEAKAERGSSVPSISENEEELGMEIGCSYGENIAAAAATHYAGNTNSPAMSSMCESVSNSEIAAVCPSPSPCINRERHLPSTPHGKQQTLKKGNVMQMQKKRYANVMEMRCIVEANLSFNLLKLPCWRNMLEAFSQVGDKYSGVTYNYMRNKGLKSEMHTLQQKTGKIRALWPKYGCTILTDGWVDVCHRQLINVLVSCCYGTMFFKSIDCSHVSIRTDSTWLAEKISEAIKEVGSENVVQVISDNASNCVRMGTLLEDEFPHLVWTPCASHCLDLLLQDIGELPWMKNVVTKANTIVRLFGKKRTARKIFNSFSSHAILRPCKTRFGVIYIVLARLHKVWSALEQTVVSDHWNNWPDSKKSDAMNVKRFILDPATLPSFHIVLRVMGPLYSVLRLTDKEGSTIGLLYEFMRRSKEALSKGMEEDHANKSKFEDVLKLVDERWEWFRKPIHLVAHILHPLWREEASFLSADLLDAWMQYTQRLYSTEDCDVLFRELHEYRNGTGSFSYTLAREEISMRRPVTWWETFGGRTPKLQTLAVRVLSQDCSSGAAERNWNAHALAHTKLRNRLKPAQLERLVFVRENLRLVRKFETINTSPMQVNPLEIDVEKTPELPPPTEADELNREFYQTYFEETMSLRRTTRSMSRAAASTSRASRSRRGRRRPRGVVSTAAPIRRVRTRSTTAAATTAETSRTAEGIDDEEFLLVEELEESQDDEEDTEEEEVASTETESEDDGEEDGEE